MDVSVEMPLFMGISDSAVSKTSGAALRLVKSLNRNPLGLLVACYNHLGYALTVIHGEIIL